MRDIPDSFNGIRIARHPEISFLKNQSFLFQDGISGLIMNNIWFGFRGGSEGLPRAFRGGSEGLPRGFTSWNPKATPCQPPVNPLSSITG